MLKKKQHTPPLLVLHLANRWCLAVTCWKWFPLVMLWCVLLLDLPEGTQENIWLLQIFFKTTNNPWDMGYLAKEIARLKNKCPVLLPGEELFSPVFAWSISFWYFPKLNKLPSPFLAHRNGFSLSPLQWRHCSLFFSGISCYTASRSKDRDIPHDCRLLPADQVCMPLVNPVPTAEVSPSPAQASRIHRIQQEGSSLLAVQPQPYSWTNI